MVEVEDKKVKSKKAKSNRFYIIINDEKHYIEPEIVKKYGLDKLKYTVFTHKKIHIEKY